MMFRPITYDDVRGYMATQSQIPSRLGSQLERLRDGLAQEGLGGNLPQWQEREESRRLEAAQLIRCIDALVAEKSVRFAWAPDILKVARRAHLRDGEVVVRVLQAYEPWGTQWPEKGLAEAYVWLQSIDRRLHQIPTAPGQEPAHSFRMGTAREARKLAASVVADAHVCLYAWVRIWSKRYHASQGTAA